MLGITFSTWVHTRAPVHALTLAWAAAAACSVSEGDPELAEPLPVDGAVSTDTPEATIAGLDVLARGGNAVDAAVAISLVLGVTEPSESGLGGSVLMLIVPEDREGVVVAGGDEASATGPEHPDALRVLHHAWSRHGSGKLTWAELVEPAILAASNGFALGHFTHRTIVREFDRIVGDRAAALQLLASDRSIPAEGSIVTNPALAAVLEQVAVEGPEAFYSGDVGQRLVAALSPKGVEIDLARLSATPAASERPALRGTYRGLTVWGSPAPHGGPDLLEALGFLELAPLSWLRSSGWPRTAWLSEALAFAAGGGAVHPVEYLASLDSMPAPQGHRDGVHLTRGRQAPAPAGDTDSAAPAGNADSVVPARRDTAAALPTAPRALGETPGQTTHFSVVDGTGTAVSVTQTLGAAFGSGSVDGMGFFYLQPHVLEEAPMVPTVVSQGGHAELVLGSPGGRRGLAAVLQVLFRVVDLEEPLKEAVSAPRLHVSLDAAEDRGRLFLEGVAWQDPVSVFQNAYVEWGDSIDARVRARGFEVGEQGSGPAPEGRHPWFGGVNALLWNGDSWEAVGDERRSGVGGVLEKGIPLAPTHRRRGYAAPTSAGRMTPAGPERDRADLSESGVRSGFTSTSTPPPRSVASGSEAAG